MAPKTKTTKKTEAVVVSAVPETNEVTEVVKTSKGKVKVAETQEVSDVPVVVQEDVEEVDKFTQIIDKLQSFINESKELILLVRVMQKEHQKLQKHSSKKNKKNQSGGEVSKRSPSGFAKPTKLSDELCNFLNIDVGSSMARTIVTKHINEYIKKNNLQDQSDKRHIIPDANLKSILSIGENDKLTYFNLQTYIKQHFKKE